MDIGRFFFPFIMAVLSNSIMIVIVYFLRKIPAFANLFSVSLMAALYLFCLIRIFVPIEFPNADIIIEDKTVYPRIIDAIKLHVPNETFFHPNTVFYIICGVWALGTVLIGAWSLVSQKRFTRFLMANNVSAAEREKKIFSEVAQKVLKSDKHITLRKTDVISGTMVVGLIRKTVLIPDETYTDDELRMIFLHECIHIRNKDLWIKLLVQIYCCLFWWNPFAYLLKSDLDYTLELKCDLSATKDLSDTEKLAYVETLKNSCISEKRKKTPFVVSAGFAAGKKKTKLLERIKAILANPPTKAVQVIMNSVTVLIILSVFVASYLFIWQPSYQPDEEMYELADGGTIVDETNSYLVKQKDGNYLFYYSNYPPEVIPKEDVESGMYDGYPIYEE